MSVQDRKLFADRCGTTANYLNMVAHGQKPRVGEALCPEIERASDGAVTCESLRADVDWVRIKDATWPHPKGRPLVDYSLKRAA